MRQPKPQVKISNQRFDYYVESLRSGKAKASSSQSNISDQKGLQPFSKTKKSFFFQSQPRFEDMRSNNYLKSQFSEQYTTISPLLDTTKYFHPLGASEKAGRSAELQPQPLASASKLGAPSCGICPPKPTPIQVQMLAEKQRLEARYVQKRAFLIKNKQNRVIQGGFRSGILSIDSPLNPET